MRCSNPEKRPPGCYRNTSEAGTCDSPVHWIVWTLNGLLSSFRLATRPSSSSTTCKVTSTEKLLPFGGARWEILNRNCTRLARGCALCCGQVSAKMIAASTRAWNQFWMQCQPFDSHAQRNEC